MALRSDAGIYLICDAQNKVLYLGQSESPYIARLTDHILRGYGIPNSHYYFEREIKDLKTKKIIIDGEKESYESYSISADNIKELTKLLQSGTAAHSFSYKGNDRFEDFYGMGKKAGDILTKTWTPLNVDKESFAVNMAEIGLYSYYRNKGEAIWNKQVGGKIQMEIAYNTKNLVDAIQSKITTIDKRILKFLLTPILNFNNKYIWKSKITSSASEAAIVFREGFSNIEYKVLSECFKVNDIDLTSYFSDLMTEFLTEYFSNPSVLKKDIKFDIYSRAKHSRINKLTENLDLTLKLYFDSNKTIDTLLSSLDDINTYFDELKGYDEKYGINFDSFKIKIDPSGIKAFKNTFQKAFKEFSITFDIAGTKVYATPDKPVPISIPNSFTIEQRKTETDPKWLEYIDTNGFVDVKSKVAKEVYNNLVSVFMRSSDYQNWLNQYNSLNSYSEKTDKKGIEKSLYFWGLKDKNTLKSMKELLNPAKYLSNNWDSIQTNFEEMLKITGGMPLSQKWGTDISQDIIYVGYYWFNTASKFTASMATPYSIDEYARMLENQLQLIEKFFKDNW